MEVARYEQLPPAVKKIIEATGGDIAIGGLYIKRSRYGSHSELIVKIRKIELVKKTQYREKHVVIHYDHNRDWEATEWSSYGSEEVGAFNNEYIRLQKTVKEHLQDAQKILFKLENYGHNQIRKSKPIEIYNY